MFNLKWSSKRSNTSGLVVGENNNKVLCFKEYEDANIYKQELELKASSTISFSIVKESE